MWQRTECVVSAASMRVPGCRFSSLLAILEVEGTSTSVPFVLHYLCIALLSHKKILGIASQSPPPLKQLRLTRVLIVGAWGSVLCVDVGSGDKSHS